MVTDLVSSLPVLEEELLEVEANMYEEVGDKRDIAQIRTMWVTQVEVSPVDVFILTADNNLAAIMAVSGQEHFNDFI